MRKRYNLVDATTRYTAQVSSSNYFQKRLYSNNVDPKKPPPMSQILYTILLNMSNFFLSGISPFLDCNFGVNGQQGYVELEVCNMAKAISRAAIVSSCFERRKEPVH